MSRRRSDRLQMLEVFLRVVERGSMSRAADDLGLSAATVTRGLQELEKTVGARLVQRDTHHLSTTAAGARFAEDAARLIGDWTRLVETHTEGLDRKNTLRVVAPIGLGQHALLDLVADYAMAIRGLSIHWRLINGPIRFDQEGCDLWVCQGAVTDDALVVTEVGHLDSIVVAAPSYLDGDLPAHPDALGELEMIGLEPHFQGLIELSAEAGDERVLVQPEVRMVTNNFPSMHRATCRGLGFSVMPRLFVEKEIRSGQLRSVLPGWLAERIPIHLVRAPSPFPNPALRGLIDHLAEHFRRPGGLVETPLQ